MVESRMVSRSAPGQGIDLELKWELDLGKGLDLWLGFKKRVGVGFLNSRGQIGRVMVWSD